MQALPGSRGASRRVWPALAMILCAVVMTAYFARAQDPDPTTRTLRAGSLEITDKRGNVRILLGVDPDKGPFVTIYDRSANPRLTASFRDESGVVAIEMRDKDRKVKVLAVVGADGKGRFDTVTP
jgi:hypothetical protein